MAKQRGKVKMFDRGGDIAELKKRCKKETGLDAPRQPEFQAWALKYLEEQPKAKGRGKSGSRLIDTSSARTIKSRACPAFFVVCQVTAQNAASEVPRRSAVERCR